MTVHHSERRWGGEDAEGASQIAQASTVQSGTAAAADPRCIEAIYQSAGSSRWVVS